MRFEENAENPIESKIIDRLETISKDEMLQMFRDFLDSYGLDESMVFFKEEPEEIQEKMAQVAKLSEDGLIEKVLAFQHISKDEITNDEVYAFMIKMHEFGINIVSNTNILDESSNILVVLDLNYKEDIQRVKFEGTEYMVNEGRHIFSYGAYYYGMAGYLWDNLGLEIPKFTAVFKDVANPYSTCESRGYQEALHMHLMSNRDILEGNFTAEEKEIFSTLQKSEKLLDDVMGDVWLNTIEINRSEVLGDWFTLKQVINDNDFPGAYEQLKFLMPEADFSQYKLTREIVKNTLKRLPNELEMFDELKQRMNNSVDIYRLTEEDNIIIKNLVTPIIESYEDYFKNLNNNELDKTLESINIQYFSDYKSLDESKKVELSEIYSLAVEGNVMLTIDEIVQEYDSSIENNMIR